MTKWALVALVLAARVARAEPPALGVDVQDLPPLPAAEEEQGASATVLAASSAEEDVVVGAAKREQSLGNVASAVTVISGDRIRRFGYRNVGEAVAAVAGTYLDSNRLVDSLGIRGINILGDFNTRILVLVDGATVNEGWGNFAGLGNDNFVAIDDVARIEFIRGPVSSLYGANAFFGIINIVTRSAAETPHAWARTSLNMVGGSITSAGFAAGGVHRQVRGTIQVVDRFGDTTNVPDVGNDLRGDGETQFAGSLVASLGGSFVQLRAYRQSRDNPFAPYNGDPTMTPPYNQINQQLLIEGGHTAELSKRLTVAARAYANLYKFSDHILQQPPPMPMPPFPPFDDFGQGRIYGAEVRGRYELVPEQLGLTAGTEVSLYQTDSTSYTEGDQVCAPMHAACVPKDFNLEGVYAEMDGQPTRWFGFTAGLRFDNDSVVDSNLSPRAALFFNRNDKVGVKLLYAQGFRNPSAYEAFFYDGTSFAQPHGLTAEKISSYEAVLWAKPVPGLSMRLSGFQWDANKILEQEPDPMDPSLLQFQNAARIVSQGVEFEGSLRTSRGWYGFGGLTIDKVGTDVGGKLVYGSVPDAPKATASWGISTPKLFGLAHLSTEVLVVGARPVRPDVNGFTQTDAPRWVDWNWTIYVPNISGFDITAGVRNLIGTREQIVAPGDYDRKDPVTQDTTAVVPTIPGEGREIYLKVGYAY